MTAGKKTSTPKAKEETPAFTEKTVGGKANGEKRLVPTNKASKYYPVRPFPAISTTVARVHPTDSVGGMGIPGRGRLCPQEIPQDPVQDRPSQVDHPGYRPHPFGRSFPRKEGRLPEAAGQRSVVGYRPLQVSVLTGDQDHV